MMAIASPQHAHSVRATPAPTDAPQTATVRTPGRTHRALATPNPQHARTVLTPPAPPTRPHRHQHPFPNEAIAIIAIATPGIPHDRRTVNRTPFQTRRSS